MTELRALRSASCQRTRVLVGRTWLALSCAGAIGCAGADAGASADGAGAGGAGGTVATAANGVGAASGGAGGGGAGAGAGETGSPAAAAGSRSTSTAGSGSTQNGAAGGLGASGTGGAGSAAGAGGSPARTSRIPASPLPSVESESFKPSGSITDIADDSAIYANPSAPESSVVIAGNKDDAKGGVGVLDMHGKLLQFRSDGKIGNVDLRSGFPLNGKNVVLVGANNRTTDTLIFWKFDPDTRQLSEPVGDTIPTTSPNYGFCLYHSPTTGKFFAFVTQETGAATMEQYELGESAGKVTATKVRSFSVGSITEGCVADDELARLYVAQEDVALWKYDAEPNGGSARSAVAKVGDGKIVADLEGIALAKGPGTSGYLVMSIQSESRFVVYDRETNMYLQGFRVGANGAIDAVTQTDGLDISTSNLGPGFSAGALIVHDGSNSGGESSNLKYIPLE